MMTRTRTLTARTLRERCNQHAIKVSLVFKCCTKTRAQRTFSSRGAATSSLARDAGASALAFAASITFCVAGPARPRGGCGLSGVNSDTLMVGCSPVWVALPLVGAVAEWSDSACHPGGDVLTTSDGSVITGGLELGGPHVARCNTSISTSQNDCTQTPDSKSMVAISKFANRVISLASSGYIKVVKCVNVRVGGHWQATVFGVCLQVSQRLEGALARCSQVSR